MSLPVRACLSAITMLALGGMPTADAAFIRRGKIKKRVTVGYKVVVVTSGDTGKVTLEQRKNGSYRLTTLTSSADGAAEVMKAAVTAEDGTVLAAASASTPDSLERRFVADGLTFEDPAIVVGGRYSVLLDPFAADASILEGSAQVDVLVADGTTEVFIEDLDPTDGLEIGYLAWVYDADLDEWFVDVAVTGEAAGEVASVELQIDSLSGNAAVEPTLSAVLVDQWSEYNLTFDSDTDITETAPVMVDITVQDETGATVDSAGASTSTGVVYKSSGFGKGTRNTATSAASKPELL